MNFKNNSRDNCQLCGKSGHNARQCRGNKPNVECQLCGMSGHSAKDCRGRAVNLIVCQICEKPGHKADKCFRLGNQNAVVNQQMNSRAQLFCEKCNRNGHTAARCFARTAVSNSTNNEIVCFYCKQPGHFIKDCKTRQSNSLGESENSRGFQSAGANLKNRNQDQRQKDQAAVNNTLSELIAFE